MVWQSKTSRLLSFNFALALFIILWGAWVRLSGSGAGCGEHWPMCNGEVIPTSPSLQTIIEFTHRATSGIFGITVFLQVLFARSEFGKRHLVFKSSVALFIITIIEALIGAVLVKKGLVTTNASSLRAWVIGAHLINTLLLLGAMAVTEFAFEKRELKVATPPWQKAMAFIGLSLVLVVGSFGAIAALGNTLFPAGSLAEGVAMDFSANAPFLVQLRIFHPALALVMGLVWIVLLNLWRNKNESKEMSKWLSLSLTLILTSLAFGVVNWLLMAPVWGALMHLFLADLLWMSLLGVSMRKIIGEKKISL